MVIMSYSYQKQIERLLDFIEDVAKSGRLKGNDYFETTARKLLNDEPMRLTTYGLLENPERKAPERKYNYPRYF